MINIILTSGPSFSIKKENGERKAIKLANPNLIQAIKENVLNYDNLLFVCKKSFSN